MKQISMFAFAAALTLAGFTSCSDDDDVTPSGNNNVMANGIVLLQVPEEVVAGDTVSIGLRVNPSTTVLTKDNFSLDCYEPNVYEVELSKEEKTYLGDTVKTEATRASYVTSSESFSIVELLNDSLNGEPLDGQYVLRIAAQSDRNIIDCSRWTLVCSTLDANGDTANISSELFSMKQIPQPKGGIFAWAPQAQNYTSGKLKSDSVNKKVIFDSIYVNGAKWYLTPRKYKNPSTEGVMTYDYDKYVHDVTPALLQDTTVLTTTKEEIEWPDMYKKGSEHAFSAVPDSTKAPFSSFGKDGKNYETLTNVLTVTDKYGHVSVWMQPLNYVIPTTIYTEVACDDPIATGKYYVDDIKGYMLTNYGIDIDIIKRYPMQFAQNKQGVVMGQIGGFAAALQTNTELFFDGIDYHAGSNKSVSPELLFSKIFLTDEIYGVSEKDVIIKVIQKFKRAAAE